MSLLSFKELAPNAEERIQCTLDAKRLHADFPLIGMDITVTKSDGSSHSVQAATIGDIELSDDDIDINVTLSDDFDDDDEAVAVYKGNTL